MTAREAQRAILVVKLSSVGNVVLSFASFAAIRRHHANGKITLLTTAPYAAWMSASPYFDAVWIDDRPAWWDVQGLFRLRRRFAAGRFDRVYDLQSSRRTAHYCRMLPRAAQPKSPESDAGRPKLDHGLHAAERQVRQLRAAGIDTVPRADLNWCSGAIDRFELPQRFALLIPGCSAHRPGKRWPIERYGALARAFAEAGIASVVLGTAGEAPLAAEIARAAPVIDLTGQTGFGDIASLARAAAVAVGNDTGPMHLIAAVDCPSVVLFSEQSDPALCAPRGEKVVILRRPSLAALDLGTVRDTAFVLAATPSLTGPVVS